MKKGTIILLLLVLAPLPASAAFTCVTDDVLFTATEAPFDFTDTTGSVCFWVQHTASPNNSGVIEKGAVSTGWGIRTTTTNNSIRVIIRDSAGISMAARNGNVAINTGAWIHICIVMTTNTVDDDLNFITIYINGVAAQDAQTEGGSLFYFPNDDPIQMCKSTASVYAALSLDNIEVISGDVGAAGAAQRYSSKMRYPQTPHTKVAHWPLDECNAGTALDGVAIPDRAGGGNTLTGQDGANNTGMTCAVGAGLLYLGDIQ